MKSPIRTAPLADLPGHFCASLEGDTVFCSWKNSFDSSFLFYFWIGSDDPNIDSMFCRKLAFLEFDFLLENTEEARDLARVSWEKYKKQILAHNGDFLSVADLVPDIRKSD